MDFRRGQRQSGHAWAWLRPRIPLVHGEPIGRIPRLLGLVDFANGLTLRLAPTEVAFPNVDLTCHLFAVPEGDWIGFDTTVSIGPTGLGLTDSVLHDERGPVGTVQQILTVRPMRGTDIDRR